MALFVEVARLAETLAGEGSRLKKRAAIAGVVAGLAEVAGKDAGLSTAAAKSAASGRDDISVGVRGRNDKFVDGRDREDNSVVGPGRDDGLVGVSREKLRDAGRFCLYLAGQPFAEADPRKLNAGGALLTRAVKEVSGCTDAALTAAYRRHGDLGAAAHDLLIAPYGNAPATAVLTLEDVAQVFEAMAAARVTASRAGLAEGLLRRATALEAKYLLKLMLGDMRIGVKQSLIEEAIAVAAGADVAAVRHAVMLEADLGRAVGMAFAGTLAEARMRLFHPLGFMLASPVDTPEEAVKRFAEKPVKAGRKKKTAEDFVDLEGAETVGSRDAAEEGMAEDVEAEAEALEDIPTSQTRDVGQPDFRASEDVGLAAAEGAVQAFLEDKYDGMRAQVHCGDPEQPGRVAIYSRNREDITESFPEIAEALHGAQEPLIFDGEILGWDVSAEKALPFAVLGQRIGRKRVDNQMRRVVPVVFMAFDLLLEGGELLLPRPLRERRAKLEAVVERLREVTLAPIDHAKGFGPGGLFADHATGEDGVQRLRLSPVKLVESAAAIDQAYLDARARANEGVMLKAAGSAYLPGRRGLAWVKLKRELATLDVVITGAEFGHGKRAGLLSDYTFAVRGAEGELLNVGKAYSGVTDAEIAELTRWLKAHTVSDSGHFRTVEPQRVLEVAFNNVMRSDRHASGFALRFPRILRIRDDKPVAEIDTVARVEEIYLSQPDRPVEQ